MPKKRKIQVEEIPRFYVEKVAEIVGPHSAAAQALADADAHKGPVKFYLTKKDASFIVEKLPPEEQKEEEVRDKK